MKLIDSTEVWVDVTIYHEDEVRELRSFKATVLALVGEDPEVPEPIGEVDGWVCWSLGGRRLSAVADFLSADAGLLGAAVDGLAGELEGREPEDEIRSALLLNVTRLADQFRGQGLQRVVVGGLLETLQLDHSQTLVVVQPEPQRDGGGPLERGPVRDEALDRLRRKYERLGFQQWQGTLVWWMRGGTG